MFTKFNESKVKQWLTKAKRYRAHGCKEKDCTFIENCAGRNDKFSKGPASA
jgi:hypothetical protein